MSNRSEEVREVYDEIAEHFDKTRSKPWDEVIEFIGELDPGDVSADLGCGNGRHTVPLARRVEKVFALDISKKMLDISKEKIEGKGMDNVEFFQFNVTNLPFRDNSLDSIIYIATLHHLDKEGRLESLREVKRVLKKDGKVLISVWAKDQPRFQGETDEGDIYVKWVREDDEVFQRYYHLFEKGELDRLVERVGLKIIESFRSGDNLYVKAKLC